MYRLIFQEYKKKTLRPVRVNPPVRQIIMSSTQEKPMRCRSGFTLIEMLVLVAVLMVLMAIITPSVTRALGSSKNVQCANNLRQVGVAILSYAQDSQGRLPPAGFYGVSPYYNRDPRNFPNSLREQLDLRPSTSWSTQRAQSEYAPMFACPAFAGPRGEKGYGLTDRLVDEYGNTVRPWGFMTNAQGSLNPPPARLDMIPSSAIAMQDRDWQGKISHQRHRNALRFDFSVTPVPLEPVTP
jgi:type II secretory pathway pseudopilin PulG